MAWTESVNPGEGLAHPEDVVEGDICRLTNGIWVTVVRDTWEDVWTARAYRDDGNGGIEAGTPRYFNGDWVDDPEGEDPLGYAFDDLNFVVKVDDYLVGVAGESSSSYDADGTPNGGGDYNAVCMFLTIDPDDLSIERTGFCVAPWPTYYSDETTAAAWDGKLVILAAEGPKYMAVCDPADESVTFPVVPTRDNRAGPVAVTGNTALYWNDGNDGLDAIGWYAVPLDGDPWDNNWHVAPMYNAKFYTNGPDIQGEYYAGTGVIRRKASNGHAARFTLPVLRDAVQSGGTWEIEMTVAVAGDTAPLDHDYAGSSYLKAIASPTEAAFDSFDWRQLGEFTGGSTSGVYTVTVGPGLEDWDDSAADGFGEFLFYPQYGWGDFDITQIRYRRTDTADPGTGPSGLIDGTDYGQYYSWAWFTETLSDGRIAAIVTNDAGDGTDDAVELIVFDADLGGVSGPYPLAAAARNVGWTGGWYSNVRSISETSDGTLLIAYLAGTTPTYTPTLLEVDPDTGDIINVLVPPSTEGITGPWIYQVVALDDPGKYVSLVAGYGGDAPDVQGGGFWSTPGGATTSGDCDELVPPDWRNLILDPSGESDVPNLWASSNGPALAGSAGVPPLAGYGSLRYVVSQNGPGYYGVRPVGPSNECHLGAFRIPDAQSVAARLSVRTTASKVVRLTAELLSVNTISSNGNNATWNVVGQVAITPYTATTAGSWVELEGSTDLTAVLGSLGATHWRLVVNLYGGTTGAPVPPTIGDTMYVDKAMVPDSGLDLSANSAPFVEGNQPGCYWEGPAKSSTSRTGVPPTPEQPPEDGENPDTGEPPEDDDDATDEPPEGGDGTTGPGEEYEPPPVEQETPDWVLARQGVSRRVVPTNFRMRSDIELPGLLLNQVDDFGTTWVCSDLEGWWTLPEPEVPDMPRAWFDGSFETRGRYAARVFTVTGSFWPRSPEGMAAARDLLFRSIDLCHRGDWFMAHEDYTPARTNTKGAKVWLSGQPLITTVNPTGRTDFAIGLRAPDPIKYGIKGGVPPGWEMVTLLTNGAQLPGRHYNREYPWQYPGGGVGQIDALVENKGNAIVWPMLTIPGPTNGPMTLYNTDTEQSFRITRALFPDETLQIDCFTKQVTMNGVGNYRFYVDIDADWPMLQPGPNRLHFVDEVAGSVDRVTIEVRWRHGWIG